MNPSVALPSKRGWKIITVLCVAALCGGHAASGAPKRSAPQLPKQNEESSDLVLRPDAERKAGALAAFVQGTLFEENGEVEGALDYYQKSLALDATNTELAVRVAYELVKRSKTSDAISLLKDAAKAAPNAPGPVLHLALLYHQQLKKSELALKYALEAIRLGPDNFSAFLCAYEIYAESGQTAKAEQMLSRAETLNSGNADFWLQLAALYARLYVKQEENATPEQAAKIDTMLRQALQIGKDDTDLICRVADFYALTRQLKEAVPLYMRAIKLKKNPTDAGVVAIQDKLARVYLQSGDTDKAVATLQEIIRANPLRYESYELLGAIYEDKRQFDKALGQYQQLLLLDSSQTLNFLRVADMQLKLKDLPKALEVLGEAHRKFPEVTQVTYSLAVALSQAKRHQQALTMFQIALQEAELNQPQMLNAAFYFAYGAAAEQAGDLEKAATLLRRSIELDPGNAAEAYNYLGYMWIDRGMNLEEAGSLIERALQAQPENPAFLDSLGWYHFKKGEPEKALPYLQKAAELLQPADADVHEHLGDVYQQLNQAQRALEHWRKALELDPQNKSLSEKIARAAGN